MLLVDRVWKILIKSRLQAPCSNIPTPGNLLALAMRACFILAGLMTPPVEHHALQQCDTPVHHRAGHTGHTQLSTALLQVRPPHSRAIGHNLNGIGDGIREPAGVRDLFGEDPLDVQLSIWSRAQTLCCRQ